MSEKRDRYGNNNGSMERRSGASENRRDSETGATRPEMGMPRSGPRGDANATSSSPGAGLLPALALPKGGGALRGIGEKFATNPATGTGALTVPIATSPGRAGFELGLLLSYDSGAGNGPFGLGWSLSTPAITRKTDKGLPRYADAEASDVFVLSGAEDLVPVRVPDGDASRLDVFDRGEFRVQRYRPRVEGLFARIERWTRRATGDAHWRAATRDNVLSIYGQSGDARIADPEHPEHVFSWLLEETRDDRGNVVCYRYKAEDAVGVDAGLASEANRFVREDDRTRRFTASAQRYLKRVQYGNRSPIGRDEPAPARDTDWLFEAVFDYGEHDALIPTPEGAGSWAVRTDPFSSYRATFEVRTYRRCQRVLMFHRFAELGDTPCLVRSTDFTYEEARIRSVDGAFESSAVASYLTAVTQAGYIRNGAGYERATLPPLGLGYAQPVVHDDLHVLSTLDAVNLPGSVRGDGAQWVDLDGEGIPGVLLANDRGWYFRSNAGEGVLGPPVLQRSLPSPSGLGGAAQLTDLDGDGNLDLVQYAPPLAGFFARTNEQLWEPFIPFRALPQIDWSDPNLRFLDLDGDGFPDILITESDAFVWYHSRSKDGFDPAVRVHHPHHELEGPALIFADPSEREAIYLADMAGDGMVDLVRVRNGEVCYWPNLGYGRFGRKVTFDHSPRFDASDRFVPARIRFSDIDGSGTSDLVYLNDSGATVYFNCAGNALSAPMRIETLPPVDALSSLHVVDLLGHGTACLVWTSANPGLSTPALYVDLMAAKKPHLLESVVNHFGGETRISYASSTKFYLQDKADGQPWLTRLAFPVHVIERVEQIDHVTETRLVNRFRYHHGYFDGYEREFRGFARVEQWDAESFAGELDLPPVRTVTWFHTGAWLDRERLELGLAREYYADDPQAPLLPDTRLPAGLTVLEEREAARAMRGQVLRQEIYAEDGIPQSAHPYSTSERSYQVRLIQHAVGGQHAVFLVTPQETVDVHYERAPSDPRTQHQLVLDIDDFGNVTRSAAIGYPRRSPEEPEQGRMWVTVSDASFVNRASEADWYRIGVPIASHVSELTGLAAPASGLITAEMLRAASTNAAETPFETEGTGEILQRRVIQRQRTLYYRDDLSGPLASGVIESRVLPFESYTQAFTPGLLTAAYGDRVTPEMLTEQGRYVLHDGIWWVPSGRVVPDPSQFYLPIQAVDPFGHQHVLHYDSYALLPREAVDPLGNRVTIGLRDPAGNVTQNGNDYRVLGPVLLTDPNRNRTAVALDALGMLVKTAVLGKEGAGEGDTLEDPTTRLEYDLHAWNRIAQPAFVHTLAREHHGASNPRWQESYHYTDGFGRGVMSKVQAEPGPVPLIDEDGRVVRDSEGTLQTRNVSERWVGTGRTVFDNKSNPVKQYEPFFSDTSAYEDEREVVEWGVTPILHYDPVGRVIHTNFPDGTRSRVEFDAWSQASWDQNDTVAGTPWLIRKQSGAPAEQRAAALALAHTNTPTISRVDTLGRTFLTVADNGAAGQYATRVVLDISGNTRSVTDARGIVVATHVFDLLGRTLQTLSADAGETRNLPDVGNRPMLTWTPRGHRLRQLFDSIRRPTHRFLREATEEELLTERMVYGEAHHDAETLNLLGAMYQCYDGAGVATTARYDFRGNPIEASRRLTTNYQVTPDWASLASLTQVAEIEAAAANLLEDEMFATITRYDALGRVSSQTTPDASETRSHYNKSNLLDGLDVRIRESGNVTAFIANIDYNARGQRVYAEYANGIVCEYEYDRLTFRLSRQRAVRSSDGRLLQELSYEYDPIGNIVQISDSVSFGNPTVSATGLYEYDPVYQLVSTEGREHPGQQPSADDTPLLLLDHPNDLQALCRYRELYGYDSAGNLTSMTHQRLGAGPAGWTRSYQYALNSNRLIGTSLPGDPGSVFSATYSYDAAGSMTMMPHLAEMRWDHAHRLSLVDRGGGGHVYFCYDAPGRRVRKVYVHGGYLEERIYLGNYELYRKRDRSTRLIIRERQSGHVIVGSRVALFETKTIELDMSEHIPVTRIRYQLTNHLGSAVAELDDAGAVFSYEEYFSYGGPSWRASSASTEMSARRYRYIGGERDEETGLDQLGVRYYISWLGRWSCPDPAGYIDGPNLYRYSRNNPIALIDASGTDPTEPLTLSGVGITITPGEGKISVGPLDRSAGPCDELNPLCASWTVDPSSPDPDSDVDIDLSDVASGAKVYHPGPNKNVVWRKTNPEVNPDPLRLGMRPKNSNASFSAGEHVLNEHGLSDGKSQHLSASHRPGGALKIEGEPYAIDPSKVPGETTFHDTPDIERDLDRKVKEGRFAQDRVDTWKDAQRSHEGIRTKPGEPLRGEVLFEGPVPAEAIESRKVRTVKGVARALTGIAVAMTAYDIGKSLRESIEQRSFKPLARELVVQAGTWAGALAVGADLAVAGFAIGGPIGAVIGGIVGGIVGGILGRISISGLFGW